MLLASLVVAGPGAALAAEPLLSDVESAVTVERKADTTVIRARDVRVNTGLLRSRARSVDSPCSMEPG